MYSALCGEFGKKVINSLIKYHLLHLRPNNKMGYDLSSTFDEPIVTAMSSSARYAMKLMLRKYGMFFTPQQESEKFETASTSEKVEETPMPTMERPRSGGHRP